MMDLALFAIVYMPRSFSLLLLHPPIHHTALLRCCLYTPGKNIHMLSIETRINAAWETLNVDHEEISKPGNMYTGNIVPLRS